MLIISCNEGKNKSANTGNDNVATEASGDNKITFKVNDETVSSEGWVVQRFLWDEKTPAPWLNITSNMHKDKRTINVNLNGASPGTYSFSGTGGMMTNSHGAYFPDFFKPLENYSFESGEFIISEIDTVKNVLNGSFSGIAKNADGKSVTIVDGKLINVKLKPGVTNLTAEAEKLSN